MQPSLNALIAASERGEPTAKEALFNELYRELHRVARRELARYGAPLSLSPTTLLHEAYVNVSGRDGAVFQDEAHFLGYAGRAMRGLIIDHARNRKALKRGGRFEIASLETNDVAAPQHADLARLADGLDELAKAEPALAEIVDLKFFCGFSFIEIAGIRRVSERTVLRQWEKARLYLRHVMGDDGDDGGGGLSS